MSLFYRLLAYGALLLIGFAANLLSGFGADELQHLHSAWNIGQGQLPYRDYFEHHPPLFHILLSPVIGRLLSADFVLLLSIRLAALGILGLILWQLHTLARREWSIAVADWSVVGTILTYPFSAAAFQLRPDWLALSLLVYAIRLMVDHMKSDFPKPRRRASGAGLLAGLACCITQKSWSLTIGILIWSLLVSKSAPDSPTRAHRLTGLLAFITGALIPVLTIVTAFALLGALGPIIYGVAIVNFHWGLEQPWWRPLQEGLLPGFGLFLLAIVHTGKTWHGRSEHLERASAASLFAILFVVGSISFRLTPAPHIQTLVFFVVPWMATLGAAQLAAYSAEPSRMRSDRILIAASALVCLLGLRWYSLLPSLTFTGALAYLWLRSPAGYRMKAGFILISLVPLIVYLNRFSTSVRKQEGAAQLQFIAGVEQLIPAVEPVLSPWPVVAPFRPAASYHWFSMLGLVKALPPGTLDNEWMTVLEGRTRIIVTNRERIGKIAPRFAAALDSKCRVIAAGARIVDYVQVFDRGPK